MCKRNGIGTEQDSIRESYLEEVVNVPSSLFLFLPAGQNALPSGMSLSNVPVRRCSSSWIVDCVGWESGGRAEQKGGTSLGEMAGTRGSTRKRSLAVSPASGPGFL